MLFISGSGIVVPVTLIVALLLSQFVFDTLFGPGYYTDHRLPRVLAFLLSGIAIFFIGLWMNSEANTVRILQDPNTGERVSISKPNHAFFFIPIQYWGIILPIAFGILEFMF